MSRITQEASHLIDNIRIWLVHPKTPRTDLFSNLQMIKYMGIQCWIWSQKFLNWSISSGPGVINKISLVSWEKAVIRQQITTVARR